MEQKEHTLSWSALFRVVAVVVICYLVVTLFSTLILILVSLMLAAALYPVVRRLALHMPIPLAAVLVISLLFVPFITIAALVIPSFISQLPDLFQRIDQLVNNATFIPPALRSLDLTQYGQNVAGYVLRSTGVLTTTLTSIFTIIFLTLYFIIDARQLIRLALSIFPKDKRDRLGLLSYEVAVVNGQYIRGNLLISLICTICVFVGLTIMNVPFAAPLAIFAGLMDLLPLIGSTIALLPAAIIGFSVSPLIGLLVVVLFIVYQQVENSIIGPAIYNKSLRLSPALSLIAVLVGSALFGILGAFLALPIAASLPVIIAYTREELSFNKSIEEEGNDTMAEPL